MNSVRPRSSPGQALSQAQDLMVKRRGHPEPVEGRRCLSASGSDLFMPDQ